MNDFRVSVQTIPVLKLMNFFILIFIIVYIRHNFQSTDHFKLSMHLYLNSLFGPNIGTMRLLWGGLQCLECYFFSHIFIIMYIRLNFQSTDHFNLSIHLYLKPLLGPNIGTMRLLWGGLQCLECYFFFTYPHYFINEALVQKHKVIGPLEHALCGFLMK